MKIFYIFFISKGRFFLRKRVARKNRNTDIKDCYEVECEERTKLPLNYCLMPANIIKKKKFNFGNAR